MSDVMEVEAEHPLAAEFRLARSEMVVLAASDGLARQSDLARALGVTSGQIDTWRSRSAKNGFPEPVACSFGPHARGGRRGHYLWRLEDVQAWVADYDVSRQRRRQGPYWAAKRGERP